MAKRKPDIHPDDPRLDKMRREAAAAAGRGLIQLMKLANATAAYGRTYGATLQAINVLMTRAAAHAPGTEGHHHHIMCALHGIDTLTIHAQGLRTSAGSDYDYRR